MNSKNIVPEKHGKYKIGDLLFLTGNSLIIYLMLGFHDSGIVLYILSEHSKTVSFSGIPDLYFFIFLFF
jgi:hypothetical protein